MSCQAVRTGPYATLSCFKWQFGWKHTLEWLPRGHFLLLSQCSTSSSLFTYSLLLLVNWAVGCLGILALWSETQHAFHLLHDTWIDLWIPVSSVRSSVGQALTLVFNSEGEEYWVVHYILLKIIGHEAFYIHFISTLIGGSKWTNGVVHSWGKYSFLNIFFSFTERIMTSVEGLK